MALFWQVGIIGVFRLIRNPIFAALGPLNNSIRVLTIGVLGWRTLKLPIFSFAYVRRNPRGGLLSRPNILGGLRAIYSVIPFAKIAEINYSGNHTWEPPFVQLYQNPQKD